MIDCPIEPGLFKMRLTWVDIGGISSAGFQFIIHWWLLTGGLWVDYGAYGITSLTSDQLVWRMNLGIGWIDYFDIKWTVK